MKPCKFPLFAVVVLSLASAGAIVATPARAAEGCAQGEVQTVRPGQGMLMVAAYADATTFNKTPLVAMQMPAAPAKWDIVDEPTLMTGSIVRIPNPDDSEPKS